MALLADMMRAPIPLPASATGKPLLESGVLAYRRRRKSGEALILMISKRRSKKWGIPKGKIDPYLNFGEAAAKAQPVQPVQRKAPDPAVHGDA
jgi:hypothetical protein